MKSIAFVVVSVVALLFTIINGIEGHYRGQHCRFGRGRQRGCCLLLSECQIRQNVRPALCGFEGREPVVCCPLSGRAQNIRQPPVPTPRGTKSAQSISQPPVPTPLGTKSAQSISQPPVPTPFGTKSAQKCADYNNIETKKKLFNIFVVGGVQASAKEFPHMAALGFGDENDIQWQCGGTLISEYFVLTAAHCLVSQELGDVKFVRLGDLNLKSESDDALPQSFQVTSVHRNPEYRSPAQYNDIALVRLDRAAEMTSYVKPACLYTEYNLPEQSVPIATGWGRLGFAGETSDQLMKVRLSYFTNDQCRKAYVNVPQRRLSNGIVDSTQLCAGGRNESKDTCQGDSGGPLQIEDADNPKKFYVIGVTSFGKACGIENIPGVYTRVSNYISWIEETVWPNS